MVSPGPMVLGGLRASLGGVMGGRVVPFMAIRNFKTHKQDHLHSTPSQRGFSTERVGVD